jgi:hypothetical protein
MEGLEGIEDFNSFVDRKALEKTSFLVGKYYDFLNNFKLYAGSYEIDKFAVEEIARRYAYDVYRLHRYHSTERIDCHKIAGYLTYWICRLRPIRVKDFGTYFENTKTPQFINEVFALFIGMGRINERNRRSGSGKRATISKSLANAFLYGLRYRPTTGDMLSMSYYLIEKNGGK